MGWNAEGEFLRSAPSLHGDHVLVFRIRVRPGGKAVSRRVSDHSVSSAATSQGVSLTGSVTAALEFPAPQSEVGVFPTMRAAPPKSVVVIVSNKKPDSVSLSRRHPGSQPPKTYV